MKSQVPILVLLLAIGPIASRADDSVVDQPIRALLVTGGCCHDYARQKQILTRGVSARANVVWTIAHQGGSATNSKIPLYADPDWAKGFDIVVHNECFADVKDKEYVDRILKPHLEGTPAILIHCAMHCYRVGDDRWFKFVGVQSPGHGPHYSYNVEPLVKDHFITKPLGESWTAPKGELYHTIKLFDTAVPLAQAKRKSDSQPQTCIWTNQYGKGRVFCTTVGHYNETMAEPEYLDMVTRGLLWAVGREDESAIHKTDGRTNQQIRDLATAVIESPSAPAVQQCCGDGNLALGQKSSASSEETGKNNFAKNAVDGNLSTRHCAANGSAEQNWKVEFEKPEHVKSLRIHWESNQAYRYKVDASSDGENWKTIVDQSENKKAAKITPHEVDSPDTKFLRVTFHGSGNGGWFSFWELEAYNGPLPKLARSVLEPPSASVGDVTAPDGFNVTLFGSPPEVNYPVCISAAPTGELFVGVDEQGSLGKEPNGGRVLRCIDTDGDGKADKINVFAEMDHPRGLIYDAGSLWVLHPPFLSVYHDTNLDGVADKHETLITGISTDEVAKRGADHTTNGIRMGIDGWIYIAVGDFGMVKAVGTDGKSLSKRGGGIVRVRPDGSDMEIYAWGLRNILDACIDPYMNVFTRDNTNDGGGWDIRLSHIAQSGQYGYPSLYKNFTDEIFPPLADYGGGSGCGGMFLHDLRWPEKFGNTIYTCDWGRSEVYMHNTPATGATFEAHQETFIKIPRPTDIDVDGEGRMYVSSWKNGKFAYSGKDVGFVVQILPTDLQPKPFPALGQATDVELITYLASPSAVYRLHTQREILRRGRSEMRSIQLAALASDGAAALYGRAAAIFTLKQLDGVESHDVLLKLTTNPDVLEFALRALTDRAGEVSSLPAEPFVDALKSKNPRVQAQALISIGRLGQPGVAPHVLPLTARQSKIDTAAENAWKQPDASRVLPHLAQQTLVALGAAEACAAGLDSEYFEGAVRALRGMHTAESVDVLINKLNKTRDEKQRQQLLESLIRLYHREGDYQGGWWGTRPDTTGPYYDRKTWEQSDRIASVVSVAAQDAKKDTRDFLAFQLNRHQVKLEGLADLTKSEIPADESQTPVRIPDVDKNNPHLLANINFDEALQMTLDAPGDAKKGKLLFTQQSCTACHTYADGQIPKGPHLADIGKRYKPNELVESILKPAAKIAQGFDTYSFITVDGQVYSGFVVRESADAVQIRQSNGLLLELKNDDIEVRRKREDSMMPQGIVNNLTPQELADLLAYLRSL